MIDLLKQQFASETTREGKVNRVREFLQIAALKIMYDKDHFKNLAFVGGTALRILYDLKRFSEDMDFSLIDRRGYSFSNMNSEIKSGLELYGLDVEARVKEEKTVQSSFLKFPRLLKSLGLSRLDSEKLSIKFEVDSNPPAGWKIERTIVNKFYLMNLTHFNTPSLYATKLHACFFRKYIKGRDFYDLAWYIGRKVIPNFTLLNNAIAQTKGKSPGISGKNFNEFLIGELKKIDFKAAKRDVERFLEDKNDLKLIDLSVFEDTLRKI